MSTEGKRHGLLARLSLGRDMLVRMPVLVVGADTAAGRAAVQALLPTGGEVRAFADASVTNEDDARALRALGLKVAVGDLDDEAHLEAALEQVHTVVHLAGSPLTDPDELLDAFATTVSAAIGAGCRRFVWATELAASDARGNPYLDALAAAEALLEEAPFERVTLRCAVRYGRDDAFTRAFASAGLSDANRNAVHAPLHVGDLADAVRAADRLRDTNPDMHLAVELVGPDEITLEDFHTEVVSALGAPPASDGLPSHVADWLSRPATGSRDALGRSGTPLANGLAADDASSGPLGHSVR